MAKVIEEIYNIKLYKLIKNTDSDDEKLTASDFSLNIETIVQELVSEGIVVEVEKGN